MKTKLNFLGKTVIVVTFLISAILSFILSALIIGLTACALPGSGCNNWGGFGAAIIAMSGGLIVGLLAGRLITAVLVRKYYASNKRLTEINNSKTTLYGIIVLLVFVVLPITFYYRYTHIIPAFLSNQYVANYDWGEQYGLDQDFHNVLNKLDIPIFQSAKAGYRLQQLPQNQDLQIGDVVVTWRAGAWIKTYPEQPFMVIGIPGDTLEWTSNRHKIKVLRNSKLVWETNVAEVLDTAHQSYVPIEAKDGYLVVSLEELMVSSDNFYVRHQTDVRSVPMHRSDLNGLVTGFSFGQQ